MNDVKTNEIDALAEQIEQQIALQELRLDKYDEMFDRREGTVGLDEVLEQDLEV